MIARRFRSLGAQFALLFVLVVSVAACSSPTMVFIEEGNSYGLDSTSELLDTVERPSTQGSSVDDASNLRREALIELRAQGESAAELAEFVTATLPDNGRSVPYYGEAAAIDGSSTWILLEMWGPEGGSLDHGRIWVFDRSTGGIVYSSSSQ